MVRQETTIDRNFICAIGIWETMLDRQEMKKLKQENYPTMMLEVEKTIPLRLDRGLVNSLSMMAANTVEDRSVVILQYLLYRVVYFS